MSDKISAWAKQIAFILSGFVFLRCLERWQIGETWDTHFVMNIGRYILEHGFPHVDPFTVHEGIHLVAQQWLSGIVFWEAYKNFGAYGVFTVTFLVGVALVLIYWRLCLYVSGNENLSVAMAFIVGLVANGWIVPRPHIFSTLILLAEVFLLEKFTRTKNFKFLLPLPVLSVALINFHAAMWAMSLVVCLPFLFVKSRRHVKFLLAAMAGIFFCGFVNPYGIEAMTYVLNSYGVELINNNISEMYTPSAHSLKGKIFYLLEALVILSLAKFKAPWRYVLLSAGIIFMAIMHSRSLILFYFLATFPIACAWQNFDPKEFFAYFSERAGNRVVLMKILFFLLLAANAAIYLLVLGDQLETFPRR